MDIFGQALLDYHQKDFNSTLWLHNSYGSPEEMPVDVFFRPEEEMPELELIALKASSGRVLDIGAGVGSHALLLQNRGIQVTAIEISAPACRIMGDRGVATVIKDDILHYRGDQFDTLLLLMNGIGLTGSIEGLRRFLKHARSLLNEGGSLIFDSSDISYLYEDVLLPAARYYGEISYRYEYKGQFGDWFSWLYIDADLLRNIALQEGWETEMLFDDEMDQFLVRLTPLS